MKPSWIRLPPRGGACPHTGLRRSLMEGLIMPSVLNDFRPPVVSRLVKTHPQNRHGVRLISLESLEAHIASQGSGFEEHEPAASLDNPSSNDISSENSWK